MVIKTWNSFLDKQFEKDYTTIWIFDSIKSFPKEAKEGNRAILINNNTFEYQSGKWIDLWIFVAPQWPTGPMWPAGKDWVNGVDWKDWVAWVNGKDWLQGPIGSIGMQWPQWPQWISWQQWVAGKDWEQWATGPMWLTWPEWKAGKDGKDWIDGKDGKNASVTDVVAALLNNETFIKKCQIAWPKGEDWKTPSMSDILFALKQDKQFVESCKVKGDKGDSLKFEDLSQAQLELIKWPRGEGIPWPMGPKWFDGDRIFIQYSPDGVKDWSYKCKQWDKYISIWVGKQEPQVMQFIFKD